MQSKGPSLNVVRDDLCDKMIKVIDDTEMYTGKKKTRGRGPSENMLLNEYTNIFKNLFPKWSNVL